MNIFWVDWNGRSNRFWVRFFTRHIIRSLLTPSYSSTHKGIRIQQAWNVSERGGRATASILNSNEDKRIFLISILPPDRCISTLDRKCYPGDYQPGTDVVEYLQTTVELFRLLPTFDWLASAGIVPSSSRTYTLEQFQAVSRANTGYASPLPSLLFTRC
jgi:hypothetical protein